MIVIGLTFTCALLHLVFALYVLFQSKENSAHALMTVLCLFSLYCVGSTVQQLYSSIESIQVQFFAISFLPFATLHFIQSYYRIRIPIRRFVSGFTLSLGLVFFILHLLYPFSYLVTPTPHYPGLDVRVLGNLHALYQIVATILGILAIIPTWFWGNASYRKQATYLILCFLIPFGFAVAMLMSERTMPLHIIPLSLAFSTFIFFLLSRKGMLFKGAPMAIPLTFEAMEDGLLVLDQDQKIIDYSPLAQKYMPQLNASHIGLSLAEVASSIELLKAYMHQKKEEGAVLITSNERGEQKYFQIREVARGIKAKYFELTMLLICDVSDRYALVHRLERTNEKLAETNRLQSMVIQVMAHDLRSPLVAIKAMKEIFNPTRGDQNIGLWQSASDELDDLIDRSEGLINNLMMLAGDKDSFKLSPIDNDVMINHPPPTLLRAAQKKNIRLDCTIQDKVLIMGNKHLLGNAIRNITENAVKFSHAGQAVHLSIEVNKFEVLYILEDEGIGIDDAALQALEEGRWGVTRMGTAGEKGVGMGLYATKLFMLAQGGSLEVARRESGGTRAILNVQRARREIQ